MNPMKRNRTLSAVLALTGFLAACNIFNPSGEGDAGASTEEQMAVGETLFRQQDYAGAMRAFEKAIAADSTRSMAYYGYAKAVIQLHGISAPSLLGEVNDAKEEKKIPFLSKNDSAKTNWLLAFKKVRWALSQLTERDTLTRWYAYSREPASKAAKSDARAAERIAFIEDYLSRADAGQAGYKARARFPLSDLGMRFEKVAPDYGLSEMIYAVVKLQDLDGNDTIDSRDNLIKNLSFNLEGGIKVENLAEIKDSLLAPENRENMNRLIQNVSQGLGSAGTVVDLIGGLIPSAPGSDTGDAVKNAITQDVDSLIGSMGSTITFYQFGDGRDNDGDGCRDEEVMDAKDNDGDGLVDEDARVELQDGVDNDKDGEADEADEAVQLLDPARPLLFAAAPGFVKGDRYADKDYRVRVQADSARSASVIAEAKASIGGCWNNY